MCDLARSTLACQVAGIHHDTFNGWRRRDSAFALQVDQEAARGKIKRLKKSKLKGDGGNWNALAWMVERRYPADFAKPEVALNIGVIDPQKLAEIRAALTAKELEEKKPQELGAAAEKLPTIVRAFWEYQDPNTPQWRLESAEEREFLEGAGTWTG